MGSNTFGNIFRMTTWGESHGKAIGVVIDGCPAGLSLSEEDIQKELNFRKPGNNTYTSQRGEKDKAQILSGIFEGKTTGSPISIMIFNEDVDSSKYEPIKDLLRPGHANFTYLEKYGIFDYRGGGRSSARETACRVAAGAVAKKLLRLHHIEMIAYVKEIGGIQVENVDFSNFHALKASILESPVFCPDQNAESLIMQKIEEVKKEGDSLGGIIEFLAFGVPAGLGDPIYEKLEANLAKAMMTLPATKGIEIGSGFQAARMKGSEHNDSFTTNAQGQIVTETNHAGGILGGMSTGMPIIVRVAFKPTSSIMKSQKTVHVNKCKEKFQLPEGSRHDPCLTLRAVPIVEAMGACVLIDALFMNKNARLLE